MFVLRDRVLKTIEDHGLIPKRGRVTVALSGGPDSVALVHILRELATDGTFDLVGLAHFNHQLRGAAADEDEKFCREFAATLSLPIDVESTDVRVLARRYRTSIESAARQARYAFLERVAVRNRVERVAVGHTRDDQAETFILRLLRGAGTRGLSGIYPRMGSIVRPLLDVGRYELRDYLRDKCIAFRDDESNRDLRILRNRVRHELIPYLERRFSPGVVNVLGREATIAREDAEWLRDSASSATDEVTVVRNDVIELNVVRLLSLPLAIRRRIVYQMLSEAGGGRFIGFDHVETVLNLTTSKSGLSGPVDLPGHSARLVDGKVVMIPRRFGPKSTNSESNAFEYPLAVPGEVQVAEAGVTISARPTKMNRRSSQQSLGNPTKWVIIEASGVRGPLAIRSWRTGDRLRPLGLGGSKKLQDVFVDRKIARSRRGHIPLVVDACGRIIWVVGLALADDFRVTDNTQAVITLAVRPLGGNSF